MGNYDVVIVGARCAGSPLAIQLARAGLSVAVVDKDPFPSDTQSTHFFQTEGLVSLARLGVMDTLRGTGAPFIERANGRIDNLMMDAPWPTRPGDVGGAMCVRRPVLDTILVEAAQEAGAEVRTETRVVSVIKDAGRMAGVRVAGVRVATATNGESDLRAPLVVGADGRGSIVGRQAGARMYNLTANERFGYWGYYEGASIPLPAAGYLHRFGEEFFIGAPTDAGLFMVIVLPPLDRLSSFRADPDRSFDEHVAKDEMLADIVAKARRVEPLHKMLRWTGYFRESSGPGWVLVGDAGHFKDPAPAQGISDALRQVDRLAPAIVDGLGRGQVVLDEALHAWWRWRDDDAYEMHWFAEDFGRAGPFPALAGEMTRRLYEDGRFAEFVDILNHRVRPSQLLKPGPAFAATGRLLRGGQPPRRQVFRELGDVMRREIQHRRLKRHPAYRSEETPGRDAEPVEA
ncbi:MAG TPA: NAD(P)/FAD-dependent oxidoreductase [Acidimicrobiales bacterium]